MKDIHDNYELIEDSFQSVVLDEDLFKKVIDFFPYHIQVFDANGTSIMINKAMLRDYNLESHMVVGKYNILQDLEITKSGLIEPIKGVFNGKTHYAKNIRVPIENIIERYGIRDYDIKAIYEDITAFPIIDLEKVTYVVVMMMVNRTYHGKKEIIRSKIYIENHWFEEFKLQEVAAAVNLSASHFSRLFKKHTGVTPHSYYKSIKINKIKENLLNLDLSISEVFAACNVSYSGYIAKVFKEETGLSPTAYRHTFKIKD